MNKDNGTFCGEPLINLSTRGIGTVQQCSQVKYIRGIPKKGTVEIAGISQDITVLEKTDAANKMLQQVFEEFDTLRVESEHDDKLLPIISRLYQQTLKITMLHAISRSIYKEPVVDVKDVEFGYLTIKNYFNTIKQVIKESIFSSQNEEHTQKVLNVINKTEEEGITKKQLSQKTRFLNKKQRDSIMEELIESGEVELVSVNIDGRISEFFKRQRKRYNC